MKFVPYIIAILFTILFVKHEKINLSDYGNESLFFALLFMMVSTLSYPNFIQYGIRLGAISFSAIVLLATYVDNPGKLKATHRRQFGPYIIIILLLYLSWCFISVLWSVAALETIVKCTEIMVDIVLLSTIISRHGDDGVRGIVVVFCLVSAILLVAAVIGMIICKSDYTKWSAGIFGMQLNPYLAGTDAIGARAVLFIIFIINMPYKKMGWVLYALAVLVILLAQARTAIVILAVSLVVWVICNNVKMRYTVLFLLFTLAVLFNLDKFMLYFNRGAYESNLETMTGRTTIWAIARNMIKVHPLIGYGYGAGGYLAASQHHGVTHTHSAFYETAMGVGYIGTGLLTLQPVFAVYRLVNKMLVGHWRKYSFEIMYAAYIIVRSYTSLGIGSWHSTELICWLFYLFLLARSRVYGSYREIMGD